MRVLTGFRANQGFLLASAVAFNTLLSILPLIILLLIVLTRFIDEALLLSTLAAARHSWSRAVRRRSCEEMSLFLAHRDVVGWVLAVTLLFFSSLAFTRARERDVGHLPSPGDGAAAAVRRLAPDSVVLLLFLALGILS